MGYGRKSEFASIGLASAVEDVDALVRSMFSCVDDTQVRMMQ